MMDIMGEKKKEKNPKGGKKGRKDKKDKPMIFFSSIYIYPYFLILWSIVFIHWCFSHIYKFCKDYKIVHL